MSQAIITESHLHNIGDSIRAKLNVETQYLPSEMPAAIDSIPTGGASVLVSKTITQNGAYDPQDDNADGYSDVTVNVPNTYTASDEGKVVSSGALIAQTARATPITQNGTYDTTENNSVTVNASALSWKDQLAVNWDFSNPVNTRGGAGYDSGGASTLIYTLDGWQLQGGVLSFVTGGIKLAQYASGTYGFFMQRFKADATAALTGMTVTISALIDGVLYHGTETVTSGSGNKISVSCDGIDVRLYNYRTEAALTIDIIAGQADRVIQAIKLEAGSTQTLATQIGGVWTLNNSMDADTEYIKARSGTVYNS